MLSAISFSGFRCCSYRIATTTRIIPLDSVDSLLACPFLPIRVFLSRATWGRQASSDDKIWADGNKPATLIDGDKSTDFYTLGEAVIAHAHLPDSRKAAATIKSAGRAFTAGEIDRLYHKPTERLVLRRRRLRVLVDLQKLPGPGNGGGEVALTYQCTRPTIRQVGATGRRPISKITFETEKLPYKTDEEGEELMQQYLKYLVKGLAKS